MGYVLGGLLCRLVLGRDNLPAMVGIVKDPNFQPPLKVGDSVRKPKGYRFDSVVIGVNKTTEGKIRIDAQIDASEFRKRLDFLIGAGLIEVSNEAIKAELYQMVSNCDGMIHIFSLEQLEKRV
jgi:hypothetical protein